MKCEEEEQEWRETEQAREPSSAEQETTEALKRKKKESKGRRKKGCPIYRERERGGKRERREVRVLMAVLSTLMRLLRNHRITMGSVHHYGITSHVDHILHYTLPILAVQPLM